MRKFSLRLPLYRRVVLVAALILGSHAMHDSFAVIRWGAAGIGPGTAGLLWSLSVAAEVIVFLFVGRPLLDRLAPAGAAMLAAAAGVVRWAVLAETAWLPALAQVSYSEGLANHTGPESCVGIREDAGEALTGEHIGQPSSRESLIFPDADMVRITEGNMGSAITRAPAQSGVVEDQSPVRI